jgi:hypothetical protein
MSAGQTPARPPIGAEMEKEVRRRCGFGCVMCGLPLYEYDHILGWSNVQRHVAEEITLLCDMHHREKTNGLLPLDHVVAATESRSIFAELSPGPMTCTQRHWLRIHYRVQ